METFLTKYGMRGMEPFLNYKRQKRNGTGWPFFYSEQNGMRTGWERNDWKKERERNAVAEGPCSRMERNDLKKVGMCQALHAGLY